MVQLISRSLRKARLMFNHVKDKDLKTKVDKIKINETIKEFIQINRLAI